MGSRETEVWVIRKAGQSGWVPGSNDSPKSNLVQEHESELQTRRLPGKNRICAKHQHLPFTEPVFCFNVSLVPKEVHRSQCMTQ